MASDHPEQPILSAEAALQRLIAEDRARLAAAVYEIATGSVRFLHPQEP